MAELDRLARELREELGSPPESWLAAQRARVREALRVSPRRPWWQGAAPWAVATVAALAAVLGLAALRRPAGGAERWLTSEELRAPLRLDDGSSISLAPGSRGRLYEDGSAVRFDLHHGRASFDVVPARRRTWTVSAGKNEVRVVGTRFSVFYGSGESFEVEVERGVVAVKVPERNASIELGAGDHLHGHPGRMEVAHRGSAKAPAAETPEVAGSAPAAEAPPPAPPSAWAPSVATVADWQLRYREGKYAESLALVRSTGVAKRLEELGPGLLADLADAARLGGEPELAVRALSALLRRFPNAPEARDGAFLLGRVHALRADRRAAIDAFERYLGGRQGRYASEALGRLMELYSARGDREKAREMARRYLERAPKGPYGRLARSLLE